MKISTMKKILKLENLAYIFPVAFFLAVIQFCVNNYSPVPYWDSWDGFYGRGLFEIHNEGHRISLTRLVFMMDHHLFKSHFVAMIAYNIILMVALFFVFAYLAKKRLGEADAFCISLVGCCIFFLTQMENMVWEFQSQMFLALLLPLLAFLFFGQSVVTGKKKNLHVSIFFAILANFAMGNGFLSALIIFPLLFLMRADSKIKLIAFCAFFFPLLLLFLHKPATSQIGAAFSDIDILRYIKYCLLYLGSPWAYLFGNFGIDRESFFTYVAGAAFIFLFLCQVWTLFECRKYFDDPVALSLSCFILYVILTACLSGIARYEYSIAQAMSPRYTTSAVAGWAALLIAYWPGFRKKYISNVFSIILMLAMTSYQMYQKNLFRQHVAFSDAFMATMSLGLEEIDEVKKHIVPRPPNRNYMVMVDFYKDHPGFFTNSARYVEIRNFLSSAYFPDFGNAEKCDMEMMIIGGKNAHHHIYGWLKYHPYDGKPHMLLAYDRNLEKTGFISLGIPRLDVSRDEAYIGFIGLTHENSFPGKWYLHDPGNGFSCFMEFQAIR